MKTPDFLIIGAGIVGLAMAREILARDPGAKIVILEKEPSTGRHSSGRNSGVLHSGIYYPPGSIKARVCTQGARELAAWRIEHKLPLVRRGKVLVATREEDGPQFDILMERAKANGVAVERLDERALSEREPEARSATGEALFVPSTSVGDRGAVVAKLTSVLVKAGVDLRYGTHMVSLDAERRRAVLNSGETVEYGHAINCAGLHADTVAHRFGVGEHLTLLPFKGVYWRLDPAAGFDIRHLIYPVPDLRVPFLGVHTTTAIDGTVYLGPAAMPAFGRENYAGFQGVTAGEALRISNFLFRQVLADRDGFRQLAWTEGRRAFKHWFVKAGQALLPRLRGEHVLRSTKVGIRAQMLDRKSMSLVNDFLIESGPHSTHVLNAISPAWTSAFPFARLVLDRYTER